MKIRHILACAAVIAAVFPAVALAQTYEYDALGRLTKVTSADGAVVVYDYDEAGNRENVTATLASAVSVSDASATEGGALVFTITRSVNTSNAISVNYATSNGSALAPDDYAASSGVVSFASGEATKTFSVTTVDDATFEAAENFSVALSNATAGAVIGDGAGVGTINDNDSPPYFSVNDATAAEGGALSFTITKGGNSSAAHNVTFQTANGTATAGTDYTAQGPTTLTFQANETTKSVVVATSGDATYEPSETMFVNLSGPTGGATLGDNQGQGTLSNDDAAPVLTINSVAATEGQPLNFTVTKTGASDFAHAVSFATSDGTALAGADYTANTGAVTFQPNETQKTITVTTIGENFFEPNETLTVTLSAPTSGATLGSPSAGVGTINNDDANIQYVRDAAGALQPGYVETETYSSKWGYIYRTKTAGGVTIHTSLGVGYCDTSVSPIAGYSWTGNGCEMRVN